MILRSRLGNWDIPFFHLWGDREKGLMGERKTLVDENTSIATIGSCFASELAQSMSRLGLQGAQHPGGLFYNTASIRSELERIASKEPFYEEPWSFNGTLCHPLLSPSESFENLSAYRSRCDQLESQSAALFFNADIVVVTLGLIEIWELTKSQSTLRQIPHPKLFPDLDVTFRRLTVGEMLEDLDAIRIIVKETFNAELIITVSPIPLHCTFTNLDVRVANADSKCRIKAAVSEFLERHQDVHYFHSYEIVATSEKLSDFMKKDGRHVHRHAVDYIVGRFLELFAKSEISARVRPTTWWLSDVNESAPAALLRYTRGRLLALLQRVIEKGQREWKKASNEESKFRPTTKNDEKGGELPIT